MKSKMALWETSEEHDNRVYCPVMDTLGAMGKVAAPYIALLKARLEALWKFRVWGVQFDR